MVVGCDDDGDYGVGGDMVVIMVVELWRMVVMMVGVGDWVMMVVLDQ